ncbi:MAG TPA: hypothetical protein VN495_02275, partial [Candidatus Paceibacterota bacterium]|nr:hypothetical protein [Candidatus Paceibacterota bacterium]
MRITRAALLVFIFVPSSCFALSAPFVGSPFAHMTPPFIDRVSLLPDSSSQTATAAAPAQPPGVNDICYSVTIKEEQGKLVTNYSSIPDDNCEALRKKYPSNAAACQSQVFRSVVGDYRYEDLSGTWKVGKRCDHLNDSAPAGMSVVYSPINSGSIASIDRADPGQTGSAQMVDMYQNLGVPQAQAQQIVDSNPQQAYDFLNNVANGDGSSAQTQQLGQSLGINQDVLNSMGQIEPTAEAPGAPAPSTAASGAVTGVGQNDMVRNVANAISSNPQYNIQDPKQFADSMVALPYAECGPSGNCGTAQGSSQVVGNYQEIPSYYNQGIQTYVSGCDTSTDACQYAQAYCANVDGRMDPVCNTAAAAGHNVAIESAVQASNCGGVPCSPAQQAAIHQMYQIGPTQVGSVLVTGDPNAISTYQVSPTNMQNLCNNGACPQGSTGLDAINAMANVPNMQNGVNIATNGNPGTTIASASTVPPPTSISPGGGGPAGTTQTQIAADQSGPEFGPQPKGTTPSPTYAGQPTISAQQNNSFASMQNMQNM